MMHSGAPSGSGPEASTEPPLPPPPNSTNNNENELLASLTRLSLQQAATTTLPPTPGSTTPNISRNPSSAASNDRVSTHLPPTTARKPKPAPFGTEQSTPAGPRLPVLRRQASNSTLDARANTPTLLRKASMNSLQKANSNAVAHNMNGGSNSPRASTSRRSSYSQDAGNIGRGSSYGKSPLSIGGMDGTMDERSPKPILTAEGIAHEYFTKWMATQNRSQDLSSTIDGAGDKKAPNIETVVILHDACYGHRFSRPKTSKAALSTIVERPERIHASILGVSAAYVKLGERGSEDRYAIRPAKGDDHDDENKENRPPPRPFNIIKSARRLPLSEAAVTNVHGVKWMEELKILCEGAEAKLAHNGKELIRPVMDRGNGAEEPLKFHEGDLYLCSESLDAMEGALGAVCDGVDAVFGDGAGAKTKRVFVVVRPPGHHCSAGYPSGFCWVNNVHVGIQHAALTHGLTHAAIIDFDLHHGDGSQDIAWGHNERGTSLPKNAPAWKKTSIGYFSIHDINSYPCEMGDTEKIKNASLCISNAHGQNIWNVHLAPWKSEDDFWKLYENKYTILLEKTRLFLKGQTDRINETGKGMKPRAAIFLSAGFDASEHESSGMQRHKVNVPTEFYARLTRDVRRIAEEEGTSVEGRIISVLEGGYSDRALCSGVFSHISALAGSDPETYEKPVETTGLGAEVARRMGSFPPGSHDEEYKLPAYDPSWWALSNLEALEAASPPPPPPAEPKKPRENGPPATYYASTQSFDAKITESPKGRRSSSGLFAHPPPHGYKPSPNPLQLPVRATTPPAPDVPWTVAAKELCKVLIPTDRQTGSCKPEDLNTAATRERKERQSLTLQGAKDTLITPPQSGPVSPEPTPSIRKSTRERKPARPVDTAAEEAARVAAAARAGRRRTVAGAAVIATDPSRPTLPARGSTARQVPTTARTTGRRASLASNTDFVMGGMEAPPAPLPRTPENDGMVEVASRTSPRSSTSISVRPESGMSARGAQAGIAVRKTRAPPVSRGAATTLTSRAPASRRMSGSMPAPAPVRRPSGPPEVDGTSERRGQQRAESTDMDTLSAGMQKARITLTTKAQREAKAAAATEDAKSIARTTPHYPGSLDGAASPNPKSWTEMRDEDTKRYEEMKSQDETKRESTEHKMGMVPLSDATQAIEISHHNSRPDYSTSTSQLHASQQLNTFTGGEEHDQQGRHLDQQQHDEQRRDETFIVEQLQAAAHAAAEMASEGMQRVMSPPPRPSTAGSRPGTATSGSVASPSGIKDRIQRLAQVSNAALESAREMGSGRSSFSDNAMSPTRGLSRPTNTTGTGGGEEKRVMGGPVGVKREELPVWSSTGMIPFAEPRKKDEELRKGPREEVKKKVEDSIWEVPEAPRK